MCSCSPLGSPDTLFAVSIFLVFAADMWLNFFVAYYDTHGDLVTDLHSIAGGWLQQQQQQQQHGL
jgi:hypothetical protein